MNKPRKWIEVSISADPESFEAVGNFLFENGCCGLEEGKRFVKGYFSGDFFREDVKTVLKSYLRSLRELGFSVGDPQFQEVVAQDWSRRWREKFKPIRVTSRIVIKPPWEEWKTNDNEIVIDIMPRMAFGTGTHETTQLCLKLLDDYLKSSDHVLDVGTGSGVLAIAAAKLGASEVLAVDINEDAVDNAKENVIRNYVSNRVKIFAGSVEAVGSRRFDLILANIDRPTLADLLSKLKCRTNFNGRLIFSGILETEKSQIETVLTTTGYELLEEKRKGE